MNTEGVSSLCPEGQACFSIAARLECFVAVHNHVLGCGHVVDTCRLRHLCLGITL